MGWFMRVKLEALPIVDIDNMGAAVLALASVSVEPQVLKRMVADHKTQLRKYCKDYRSLAEIDAYAIEQKQSGKWVGMYGTWKRVGPYLVFFSAIGVAVRLGFPADPRACIIRTGPSTWRTCNLSAMERDFEDSMAQNVEDSSETQVEPRSPIRPKAKTKRKVRPKREYACVVSANGKYYHRPNCRLVKSICDENLVGFYSTSEPKALGFERCSRCKPFQAKTKPNAKYRGKAKRRNTYWGSATGQCFHRLKCQLVKSIKKEDLIAFDSIEEAKGFGYKKCRRCNP